MKENRSEEKILSSEEIKYLLNETKSEEQFSSEKCNIDTSEIQNGGIESIVNGATTRMINSPQNSIITDNIQSFMEEELNHITNGKSQIAIKSVSAISLQDYIASIKSPLLSISFESKDNGINNRFILNTNKEVIYLFLEAVLGDDMSDDSKISNKISENQDEEAYSEIEKQVAQYVASITKKSINYAIKNTEKNLQFQNEGIFEDLASLMNFFDNYRKAMLVKFEIMIGQKIGMLEIIFDDNIVKLLHGKNLPHAEKSNSKNIVESIEESEINLAFLFQEKNIKLEEISQLKLGDSIMLDCGAKDDILLRVGTSDIAKGKIFNINGKPAIKISNSFGDE